MDVLLDSPRSNRVCSDVQDLQDQLHKLLKSSDTRAEHASVAFQLRHNTVFYLAAEPDGADPAPPHELRTVNASETIHNQPTDDPVLQKAVAKHISGAIGAVDGSAWSVRQVARGAQGWKFTYICKDSLQAWNRANTKSERPVIGDYSGPGGLDPINSSRPAFDCRGALTVAFSKSSRGVVVKYEHTPFHTTVAQLVERLAPSLPPPPPPVHNGNGNNSSQRTPKAKRPPPAEGEESNRKKRKKKGKAPEAPMMAEPPVDHENTSQPPPGPHPTPTLNVPPVEAERRRQTAIELLSGRGIDPATLSAEQFNIFANQAPNLQSASLEMLAKYGAERLRIVHPDDHKDQTMSSNSTPTKEHLANATPVADSTVNSVPGATETPSKKRRNKKKLVGAAAEVSIGDGAVVSLAEGGEIGTTESALQPRSRKTRGTCDTCKQRKVKCTKEHPTCTICREAGVECIYLPPKPRRRSEKKAEIEYEDSDVPGEAERFQTGTQPQVQTSAPIPLHTPTLDHVTIQHPPAPDPDNEDFIPDPNILSGPAEHQPVITAPKTLSNQTTSTSSRRSLPSGQVNQTPVPPPAIPTQPSGWNASESTGLRTTVSPTVTHKRSESIQQGYEGMNQTIALSKPAAQAPGQQPPATRSPYQTAARAKSRQGHRSQTSTPVAGSTRPPPQAPQVTPMPQATQTPQASSSSQQSAANVYNATSASSSVPNYDPYARYSSNTDHYAATNNEHRSSRIPYEPGSYHANPTTTASTPYTSSPSYDYARNTSSTNSSSQPLDTGSGYVTTNNTTANQWPTSQSRSGHPHNSHQYSMSSTTPATSRGYTTGTTDARAPNQSASYKQSATPAYPPYPSQSQSAPGQQSQQNWYGFGTTSSSNQANYSSSRSSGYGNPLAPSQTGSYGSHRPNMGYSNHAYSGSDDQSIYDLLRASGNNN